MRSPKSFVAFLATLAAASSIGTGSTLALSTTETDERNYENWFNSLPEFASNRPLIFAPRYSRRHGRKLKPNGAQRRRAMAGMAAL